jgi:phosphoadenosine phosphosulfate reductase
MSFAKLEAVAERREREVPTEIPFSTNSFWGNHLLKSWPLKQVAAENDAIWSAIRHDEDDARADEEAFSPRENPEHVRVHPILPLTIDQLWAYLKKNFVDWNPLYDQGYTSLGAEPFTDPEPQAVQPLVAADQGERAGRAQDKQGLMEELRQEGYI